MTNIRVTNEMRIIAWKTPGNFSDMILRTKLGSILIQFYIKLI